MTTPSIWLTRHIQALLSALGRVLRRPMASLLTTVVIGIALSFPATLWLLVKNAEQVTGGIAEAIDITVYLKTEVPLEEAEKLAASLKLRNTIDEVTLIPAEQGLLEFRDRSGFGAALDALPENPLPHVLVLRPAADHSSADKVEALKTDLAGFPEVEAAQVDTQWVRRLSAILQMLEDLFAAIALMLGVGVLAVIGNVTRLEIGARRAEIEVTKLVGGSNAFVRRPFLYEGLLFGAIGGLIALAITQAVMFALDIPVARLATLYGSEFRLSGLGAAEAATLLLVGAGLGLTGAWLGAARHLSRIEARG
ncbi:MAG: permease-like cell division protein FtsX [Acidibacter sp.]|jgi:cell division transport system permease protein|nr:permease-like cell division protein FtsX [Acidibacter sp.]